MSRPYVSEFWRSYGQYKPQPAPTAADTLRELDDAFWDAVQEELRVLASTATSAPRVAIACRRLDNLGVARGC